MRGAGGRARVWFAVFLPLAVLFVLTSQGDLDRLSPDPVAAGVAAWSIAEHGSLDLTGHDPLEGRSPGNPWLVHWHSQVLSNRTPGVIAFGVPAAVIGARVTPAFTLWPERVTGALVTAAAAGLLALVLMELGASRRAAGAFAVLGALASGSWSVASDGLWTHGPDQLLLTGALLAGCRRRYWLAGLLLGGAVTVRTHVVVIALVVGVFLAWRERSAKPLLQFGLPAAAGLGLLLGYAHLVFGIWSLSPGYAAAGIATTSAVATAGLGDNAINVLGALVSPDRGLLTVSPVLVPLVLRIRPAWRAAPQLVRACALGALAYFLVQSRLNHFSGGVHFYGYRLTLEPLTLLAPLLWFAWSTRKRGTGWERAVYATLVLSVGSQLIGAVWITPYALFPDWRHSYVLNVFVPDAYPLGSKLVVLAALLGALACILAGRRPPPSALPVGRETVSAVKAP